MSTLPDALGMHIREASETTLEAVVTAHIRRYFAAHEGGFPPAGVYARILPLFERPLIVETLLLTGGNQLKAAALLGIDRNTLRKRMRALGVPAGKSAA